MYLYLYYITVVSFKFDASDGVMCPFYSTLSIAILQNLPSMIIMLISTSSKSCSIVFSNQFTVAKTL